MTDNPHPKANKRYTPPKDKTPAPESPPPEEPTPEQLDALFAAPIELAMRYQIFPGTDEEQNPVLVLKMERQVDVWRGVLRLEDAKRLGYELLKAAMDLENPPIEQPTLEEAMSEEAEVPQVEDPEQEIEAPSEAEDEESETQEEAETESEEEEAVFDEA